MLLNVLPGGNTLMHRLCENSLDEQLVKLFKKSQPNKEDLKEIKLYVPILANFNGKTPLHICTDKKNFKSIDTILTYIQHYHIDHCSKVIKDLIPEFISQDIPCLIDYLNNRML
jgi:ankyrin repeat protein